MLGAGRMVHYDGRVLDDLQAGAELGRMTDVGCILKSGHLEAGYPQADHPQELQTTAKRWQLQVRVLSALHVDRYMVSIL
jgi:hypothetical protein